MADPEGGAGEAEMANVRAKRVRTEHFMMARWYPVVVPRWLAVVEGWGFYDCIRGKVAF